MGVHGLWRLIEPSGKPVPLETLENKILAVDISIWLHQAIKGFQDAKGGALPNAHLLGVYHRVCKLLYFKIKPVFVFDGGVPALKRQTIAKRNQLKAKNSSDADKLQKQLLATLLKHTAISKVLSEKTKASIAAQTKKSPKSKDELFVLPSGEMDSTISSSDEEENFESDSTDTTEPSPLKHYDLHSIDTKSPYFQSLPLETRHEILTELKATRKQNSWGRIHELPKKSDDFSSYQMNRLLKRQQVQAALDEAAQEMGGASLSLTELENLLHDQGISTTNNVGQRIAADSDTRFLYIKDVKEALEKAKLAEEKKKDQNESPKEESKPKTKADLEEEEELQRAIALSLQVEPSSSAVEEEETSDFAFIEKFNDEDFESDSSEDEFKEVSVKEKLSSAQSYMMEYSGLTPSEISKIIGQNVRKSSKRPAKLGKVLAKKKISEKNLPGSSTLATTEKHLSKTCDSSALMEAANETTDTFLSGKEKKSRKIHFGQLQNKSERETSQGANEEIISTNGAAIIEKNKSANENLMENKTRKNAKIENANTNTTENIKSNTEINTIDTVELMSDTESSSSDEFLVVEDLPKSIVGKIEENADKQELVKLIINPEKTDEDELFSDIFEDKKDLEKLEEILKGKIKNDDEFKNHIEKTNAIPVLNNQISKDEIKPTEIVSENNNEKCVEIMKEDKANSESDKIVEDIQISKTELEKTVQQESIKDNAKIQPRAIIKEKPSVGDDVVKVSNKTETPKKPTLSVLELQEMKDNLQREKIDLLIEKSSKERLATNISDQMYQEAQELLEMFGVPYVIAPMEAEAQCAFLDEIELTDGTITDDSDIWLFGGRTVYKNFFDQAKYVMEFKAENIKHHFKLSRQQMILLALLVGSDYTIGVRGVGPVTALEILSAFPPPQATEFDITQAQLISGLKEFKAWFRKGQSGGPGRSTLKTKLKNITFTENFPNVQVVQAYMEPTIETSKEKFSWCKPDFVALTLFAREKFGWSSKKTEEILNPVIKRVEESRIQKSIKEYFKTKFKLDSGEAASEKMSKRVKLAIERFGKSQEELIAEEMELLEREREKKLKKKVRVLEGESKKSRNKKNSSTDCENEDAQSTKNIDGKEDKNQKKIISKADEIAASIDEPKESRKRNVRKKRNGISELCEIVTEPRKKSRFTDCENENVQQSARTIENKQEKTQSNSGNIAASGEEAKECARRNVRQKRNENSESSEFMTEPPKKSRRKKHSQDIPESQEQSSKTPKKSQNLVAKVETLSQQPKIDPTEELKLYENVAIELRQRRQRQNELLKMKKDEPLLSRKKDINKKQTVEIPKELETDVEVQHLLATTSKSVEKVQVINKEVQKQLNEDKQNSVRIHGLHSKEVIHQKIRDRSDLLRNKLKAIEVFRKSKKGPGFVPKRTRNKRAPKDDAGLSEDSDN